MEHWQCKECEGDFWVKQEGYSSVDYCPFCGAESDALVFVGVE